MEIYPRAVEKICFDPAFGRQMRFIAGPRQSGKTTSARAFLTSRGDLSHYYNWDRREIKLRYRRNPAFFEGDILSSRKTWVCFDEIHKLPRWKNILKDLFDTYEERMRFIVTGSARLDLFRKSGDSLAGRYFLFHLLPFTLRETLRRDASIESPPDATSFVEERCSPEPFEREALEHLLTFGGFPEPLLKGSPTFHRKWHDDYIDRVLSEDLRPLTRILEIENIANLFELLPARIGSPFSLNSVREDLEVSHPTVKSYLKALELIYMIFPVRPYAKKIQRTLKKENKIYLYDWSYIPDPGKRFENYVACELKALTTLWNDGGHGKFDLYYIRNREGKESDFLVTRDGAPWLLAEAKLQAETIASHHLHFAHLLGDIPFVQIVRQDRVAEVRSSRAFQVSASRFLA